MRLDVAALKARRAALGLTMQDAAKRAGLSRHTVAAAEKGCRVAADSAHRLAEALQLPYLELVHPGRSEPRAALEAVGLAPLPPPFRWLGREAESAQLAEVLRSPGDRVIACVAGPPGVGKTALARFVASRLAGEFPDGIVWIVAPSPHDVHAVDLLKDRIGEALGFRYAMPERALVGCEAARHAFQSQLFRDRRLLILDDVSAAATVRQFVGREGPARLLFTTRDRGVARAPAAWSDVATTVTLGYFAPPESAAYLSGAGFSPKGREALHRVTRGHPLALALVSEVVARDDAQRMVTPRDGLEAYPELVQDLLSQCVRELPGNGAREALWLLAVALRTTEDLVRYVLGDEGAHEHFEWLSRLSFVDATAEGLVPHDLIRDAILADLKRRDGARHTEFATKTAEYQAQRLGLRSGERPGGARD